VKTGFLAAVGLALCSASVQAHNCEQKEVIVCDEDGLGFTDLIMVTGKTFLGVARTPKQAFKTYKNAKLACESKKGRLPELSEAHKLANFISLNYILEKKRKDRAVREARFMYDDRPFWTTTVEEDGDAHHHKRALARLTHLSSQEDMSKARVEWVGTHLDEKEERPYICVFDRPASTEQQPDL